MGGLGLPEPQERSRSHKTEKACSEKSKNKRMRVCVHACVRACMCACVCVCEYVRMCKESACQGLGVPPARPGPGWFWAVSWCWRPWPEDQGLRVCPPGPLSSGPVPSCPSLPSCKPVCSFFLSFDDLGFGKQGGKEGPDSVVTSIPLQEALGSVALRHVSQSLRWGGFLGLVTASRNQCPASCEGPSDGL